MSMVLAIEVVDGGVVVGGVANVNAVPCPNGNIVKLVGIASICAGCLSLWSFFVSF